MSTATVDGAMTLVDGTGHTLYDTTAESAGHILCVGTCTSFWKPVAATQQQAQRASSSLGQAFSVLSRPGGGTQLAFDGHPLYTFTQEGAHQLSGNGFADQFQGTHFTWAAATVGGSTMAPPSTGSTGSGNGGGGGY